MNTEETIAFCVYGVIDAIASAPYRVIGQYFISPQPSPPKPQSHTHTHYKRELELHCEPVWPSGKALGW